MDSKLRMQWINERGRKCEQCGWGLVPEALNVHRLLPGRYGGKYTNKNVIILCPNCHAIIEKTLREMGKAQIIKTYKSSKGDKK